MPSYDVVIAGYGPTGAIAANLLGAAGLRVLLVDPSPEIYDIPRAVHIDGEVMRILQSLGMSSAVDDIDTDRQKFMAERTSQMRGISVEEAYDQICATIAAGRMGKPEEFGDACAYLCSAQAGFISGQNLQLDGGSYEGLI